MSRDVITVGSTMRIPLLYRGEYSQWSERFMNYLEEQTDGEAMINSIQKMVISQLPVIGSSNSIDTAKIYGMLLKGRCDGSGMETVWSLVMANQDLMDFQHDALYNILKQNQGDVNDVMGYKKKVVMVTLDPLALVTEKTKVSKCKEKVVVQSESEGSNDEDISDLKKITALLAKAFNRKKYYAKPTKNFERTSSASTSANKKPEYEKSEDKKEDGKKRDMSKTKMLLAKKDSNKQVLLAEDQAWMESSGDSDQEINTNMVFMAKMKKVLSDSEESSSSTDETIAEILITSESEVDHNDSEEKDHLVDKLIKKFNHKIAKCQKHLDTLSSVRRPKHSGVNWKKKGSSNTYNVDLSSDSHSKLNKDVKRYSRKDLLSCNNSHHVDTRSAYACNDAMNVSCNSRLYASCDVNDLFVFDDVSIRKSQVSKMPFRKKPRDSLNVHSRSNSNKSLPRTVFRWLPKMQPLAEPVAKWIPKVKRQIDKISKTPNSSGPIFKWIVQICLWIIDSGCSKHMTGNRALLTNFVEKFLGTVRFGNNDFAVIAGYGDVVIGSMTIKKVYYVDGLGHNLFSVGQFCDKGLEVAFRKSTCFVRTEDGVDFFTSDRSSNLYTIFLNDITSNSSACLPTKASSSQSWLWHQHFSHLNFSTINNLVKNNLVRGLPKMKFEKDHFCIACEQGKIHRKHH
ncbi:retrovirus-related pol polyprotein from transposon TNT 1-94 [Tanacetum coccineum]